ncbi:hypothetical protein FRC03_006490 [Tulasnella sp. 419]|nr:hypothetical protein FRC03_006490 [Tulasnella sp. 419]
MDLRWVRQASVTSSSFCTAQGVIKQMGDVGVSFNSAAIALHTFLVLFARLQLPNARWMPWLVVGLIWLFLLLAPLVSGLTHTNPPFYGPSTYWCWIDPHYSSQRIGLEYGLMWFVALLSAALYVPLFLTLRGNLQVDFVQSSATSRGKMKISWKRLHRDDTWRVDRTQKKGASNVARQMLAYPIVYIILILPMSVVRWIEPTRSDGNPIPSEWTAFAGIIFSSSGLVNVLLYMLTRPSLLPSWRSCRRRRENSERRGSRGENVGNNLEDGQAGAMPEMTMISYSGAPNDQGLPRIQAVPPPASGAPMLADYDDDTDEEFSNTVPSPTSPVSNFSGANGLNNPANTLSVPKPTHRSSWGSEGSKDASHSQGSSYENGELRYQ